MSRVSRIRGLAALDGSPEVGEGKAHYLRSGLIRTDTNAHEQARHFDTKSPLSPWPLVLRRAGFKYAFTAKDALLGAAIAQIGLNESSRVLDVGAGVGVWLDRINSSYETFGFGVDISRNSLKTAIRESSDRNRFIIADARNLPFCSNSFDLSISLDVLEHIERPNQALHELARVSTKGGHVLVYAVSRNRKLTLEWFQQKLLGLVGVDLLAFSAHKSELLIDPDDVMRSMNSLQMDVVRFEYFHSFFSSLFDQPLLIGNLLLKKLGAFSLDERLQTTLGKPLLAAASLVTRLALRPLIGLERPWTTCGRSNGFLALGRIKSSGQ